MKRETPAEFELWTKSDFIPSDDVQDRIHRLLGEAVEDTGPLKCEILQIQERLRDLEQKLHTKVVRIDSILSMKKIPPEIMGEIFLHIRDGAVVGLPALRKVYLNHWIFGHVCTCWRHIFWDLPSIWNNVEITEPNLYHPIDLVARNDGIFEALE
jgi:hypothetical protein